METRLEVGIGHPDIEILLTSPTMGTKYPPKQRDLVLKGQLRWGRGEQGKGVFILKRIFVEEGGGDRRGRLRSIPEQRQWKQLLGRKVWDCGGHYLWLVLIIKLGQLESSWWQS